MGCVQTKNSTNSPSQRVEKLKQDNGYAAVNGSRVVAQKVLVVAGKLVRQEGDNGDAKVVAGEKDATKNGGGGVGNGSRKIVKKKIEGDELVGGWPKWLVANISSDVLAGLVPKSADSYDKLAKIGQGTYSNVYKARDRDTGKIVALKKVRFDTSEPASIKFMAREIMILQKLDHPNVIKLEGLATSRMQYSLYLVFAYMQSDLARIISRPGQRLTLPQVKSYMQQLLSGLQHCHERGILHRDIKASNLLIDKSGMLKIADFGLANFFIPKPSHQLTSRVVTLWYRAPELLLGSTDYGVGVDLWSAGCLLAEMFLGRPFMPGRTEVEQLHRIFKLCGSPSDDYYKKVKATASFRPPHCKPSFHETFAEFPRSSIGILTTLLALDPGYRGTAASALQFEFFSSSPLPCAFSDLPVVYKVEDEPVQTSKHKKHKNLTAKQPSQTKSQRRKETNTEDAKGDLESSKELEKNPEINMQGQERMVNSGASSSSSTSQPNRQSLPTSLSPILHSINAKRFSITEGRYPNGTQKIQNFTLTEGHPNALKNIQNFTLLQASITDIVNHREGNFFAPFSRSLSTLNFRTLDPEKVSQLFGLDKD